MGIVIGVIVLLSVFGGMAFLAYRQIKKTDPKNIDNSIKNNIETAQDFLPFEDLKDSMINLGGHHYRAIIDCSSINYNLKTDREKEMIELSFQRFLNSLDFPITFYVQTKTVDNSKMLEKLKDDLVKTCEQYSNLSEYAEVYYGEIQNLSHTIGNNKQKKKYIIVPYCEALELSTLSDDEKYEYSLKEMFTRCQILLDGLNAMGIRGKILNTKGIVELLVSTYHKDNYSQAENIVSGEYMEMMVEGEKNRLAEVSNDARLDWILYEAQLRLQTELLDESVQKDVQGSAMKAIDELGRIREALAGYYQSRDIGVVKSFITEDTEE